ncbi:MAG: hypothetical protein WCU80_03210 [Paludibacteraceae bacterium]
MKKINLFTLMMMLSVLSFGFVSCDDDDDDSSLIGVDAAVGSYDNVNVGMFLLNAAGNLEPYTGELEIDKTKADVSKEGNNVRISFEKGGSLLGTKVGKASNGFTFDIESQNLDGLTLKGYNAASLGNVKYNGVYLSDSKTFTVGSQVDLADFIKDEDDLAAYVASDYQAIVLIFTIKK